MMEFKDINLERIKRARKRIAPIIQQTPLIKSKALSEFRDATVHLKLENLQPTGAFKLRGAANAILSLSDEERKRGVVTMSTGNHGRAIAYVAKSLGMKAVICVSELVPKVKLEAMNALGGTVKIAGANQDEALYHALQLQKTEGLRYISPFDDADVITGQATVMLEILDQNLQVDTLLVPLSGGGLISGIAFAAKAHNPKIQVIGVTNDTEPAMHKSLSAGRIVQVEEFKSLADALTGPISENNEYTFEMCKRYVDQSLLVSENQIAQAMAYALLIEKEVLEGGGAATLAVLMDEKVKIKGKNIVSICSGNNVDMDQLINITATHRDSIYQKYQS